MNKTNQAKKSIFTKTYIATTAAAFGVLALGLGLTLGSGSSEAKTAPAEPSAAQVSVAEVVHKPLHDWEEFTGRLEAVHSVEVRPRVNGYVDQVGFTEGSRVKKGQVLFRIDPRPFQAEVDRLTAERENAGSQLKLARSNHERAQRLIDANAISREEFDRLSTAEAGATSALAAASAALDAAKLNLEFTVVRAPIDGRVSNALITAGNLVTGSSLLTTVVSESPVYAYFDADEQTYLRYARNGQGGSAYMGLADEQGYPHEGKLDFIDNQVDPRTGTIRGRAVFDNADGHFTPGLFARVRLVGPEAKDTVLIDDRSVGTDLGRKFVMVLGKDNSVNYRGVELGAQVDGLRIVSSGLQPGETIVVNGLQRVRDGNLVEPTRVAMDEHGPGLKQVTDGSKTLLAADANPTGQTRLQK